MAFDAFVLSSVCQELEEQLLNAKIGKIHQPNKHSLILRYHNRQKKGRLLISAHPQNGRIHLTESNEENPLNPPLFCMVLRKYLENSRLIAIKQQGMERIVHFDFLIRNDLGDDDHCTMIVEIMGKHSNIILVNKDMVIIDGIRRYSHLLSRYREVLPGRDYLAPPPQEKYDYSLLDEEKLAQILFALPLNWQLKKALSATVYGLSPLLLEETICQSGLDPHLTLEELGEYEIRQLLNTVKSIMERFDLKDFQ
ncbi:MAG: NFACT family protein, partial [Clostridiales bacterium]